MCLISFIYQIMMSIWHICLSWLKLSSKYTQYHLALCIFLITVACKGGNIPYMMQYLALSFFILNFCTTRSVLNILLKSSSSFTWPIRLMSFHHVTTQELYLQMWKNNQLALSLEYNLNIAVGKFIFHYTINPNANLKRQFTQRW